VAREDALQTREQRYRARRWDRMFVSREMITSQAFLSLRTAAACQVFMIFLNKCRWQNVQIRPGSRDKAFIIVNNGGIQFSYREAKEKYGISSGRFTKALDELIRVGLIAIAHSGYGLKKDCTLYAISERWRKYGTAEFEHVERPKRVEKIGFREGNKHGRNSRARKKSTVVDLRCSTVVGNCCV